jgi:arginyl-tRNA synthetase
MIDINKKIENLVDWAVAKNKSGEVSFTIEHPKDLSHGDYSTNAALVLAKKIGDETGKNVNPRQVAELLVEKMQTKLPDEVAGLEIAGPGFINFRLKPEFFAESLGEILNKEQDFGKNRNLKREKILIEYTDPNPLKQFHIGHLMSNTIGEALSRLYIWNGAQVTRMCYQGDVGMHVAKALYGIQQIIDRMPDSNASLDAKMKFLGEAYVLGAEKYDGDTATPETTAAIKEINKKVYEFYDEKKTTDVELEDLYILGKKWSLQHFDEIYAKLGTSFDKFVMESATFEIGEEIVRKNIGKVFEESEGAVIYRGEQDGLHTRVFINSEGLPTYDSKDLGLAVYKNRTVKHDKSIIITADEQREYFKVVLAALSKIEPKVAEKTEHITHGMMQFTDGKMSSRKGNVIAGESLLSDIEKMVEEKVSDRELTDEEKEIIVSAVSVAALKYSILKQTPGKNIIFNPDQAISFEGDSGPYVQYTYTRAKSVLEKAVEQNKMPVAKKIPEGWQTTTLEKMLYQFPELIEKALKERGPHNLVTYMTQLAGEFNSYYANTQILNGGSDENYKLAITRATMIILKNCLNVLGMKVTERM